MMKSKLPSAIQSHLKIKSTETQRTTLEEPFREKFPKRIMINTTVIASVTALLIPLFALGVLALSNCGTLRVQLSPFDLQLIKESCSTPSN